jgi:hypothetical protein
MRRLARLSGLERIHRRGEQGFPILPIPPALSPIHAELPLPKPDYLGISTRPLTSSCAFDNAERAGDGRSPNHYGLE